MKNGARPHFHPFSQTVMNRFCCHWKNGAREKWGQAPFSQMNRFCCHCEERSDVAIPYNKLSLLETQKIPSLCSGQAWQSLKKRKKDEYQEVIEYAV